MPLEPMKADFPYVRTLVFVQSWRGTDGDYGDPEWRYYLSSLDMEERSPPQWANLIRGHWGGVENRNHWRKDACWFEDKTRSRNPNIVGSLILLRNALLMIYCAQQEIYGSLPAFTESMAANSNCALRAILNKL
jgi:hypothetical protein